MTLTPSQAVARREAHPAAVFQQTYAGRIASLVPTHVNGEAWVRQAAGTLRDEKLAAAAVSDFDSFIVSVERAAVLGLRPGSEEFYLRPVKIKGRLQVQGITGYQGLVDLMYRAGAVASVIVETVRERDTFVWTPGRLDTQNPPRWDGPQTFPLHEIDWDATDRGPLRLVYAYARMTSGAISKVVVLNRHTIETEHRAKSDGYLDKNGRPSEYSPWVVFEEKMWLKTGARQLSKWVPTSTEYIAQRAQAERVGNTAPAAPIPQPVIDDPAPAIEDPPAGVDPESGEVLVDWPPENGADQ